MYINNSIFNKYWQILKRVYQDKTHTQQDADIYYSVFKDCEEKTFSQAIKETIKKQRYFPNPAEINQYISNDVDKWKDLKAEEMTETEKEEMEKILEKYQGEDKA